MIPPYSGGVRRALSVAALAVAIVSVAASAAPAAENADSSVFGGLGTWVDIYDGAVYAAPEATAPRIAARGVKTVWVETANYRASTDVVKPAQLGRLRRGAARERHEGRRLVPARARRSRARREAGAGDADLPHAAAGGHSTASA